MTFKEQINGLIEELSKVERKFCGGKRCSECVFGKYDEGCGPLDKLTALVEELEAYTENIKEEFEIGDLIIVKDPGRTYLSYREWMKKNITDVNLLINWVMSDGLDDKKNEVFTVVAKAPHIESNKMLYLIKQENSDQPYIIGEDGIVSFTK